MSEGLQVSISLKQKCTCGTEWVLTFYMRVGEGLDLTISSLPSGFSIKPVFEVPQLPRTGLTLAGEIERVVINGVDVTGGKIFCVKCLEEVIYMGRGDIEGTSKVCLK